jgi:hypothetical protein
MVELKLCNNESIIFYYAGLILLIMGLIGLFSETGQEWTRYIVIGLGLGLLLTLIVAGKQNRFSLPTPRFGKIWMPLRFYTTRILFYFDKTNLRFCANLYVLLG